MKMNYSFGERIRTLREAKGLSQSQLGELTHMTQRKISYIECDKFEPGIDDIKALCLVFDISSDYLLDLPKDLPHPDRI